MKAKLSQLFQTLLKRLNLFIDKHPSLVRARHGFLYTLNKTEEQLLEIEVNKWLAKCKRQDKTAQYLIRNALRAYPLTHQLEMPISMVAVTVAVINKLTLDNIIGVQVLPEPVGQIFTLTVKESETSNHETEAKSMLLQIEKVLVEARTKRLTASFFAAPMVQTAVFHTNMDDALVDILSDTIVEEIEREFTHRLQMNCAVLDDTKGDDIIKTIHHAASQIGKTSKRGLGNFAILSPQALVEIQRTASANSFVPMKELGDGKLVGYLDNIKLYCNYYSDYDVIVGYKGPGEMDSAIFYAPHQVVFTSGVVMDPSTFEPKVSMMSRYAALETDYAKDYYVKFNLTPIVW